jgi:hypothetical protein
VTNGASYLIGTRVSATFVDGDPTKYDAISGTGREDTGAYHDCNEQYVGPDMFPVVVEKGQVTIK